MINIVKQASRKIKRRQDMWVVSSFLQAAVFLGKTPNSVLLYMLTCVRRRRSSSVTKWAARRSQERFELESPNFTQRPCRSTLQPGEYDVIGYFRSTFMEVKKLSKMPPPTDFGRILVAQRFAYPTNWWASCFMTSIGCRRSLSFITNWGARISQERLDLKW